MYDSFVETVVYCKESWTSIMLLEEEGGLAEGVSLGVTSADLLNAAQEIAFQSIFSFSYPFRDIWIQGFHHPSLRTSLREYLDII